MPECRTCKKEIAWVRTESGKMMPIDIDVEIVVEKDGERIVVAKPHWASCPQAESWRKKHGQS